MTDTKHDQNIEVSKNSDSDAAAQVSTDAVKASVPEKRTSENKVSENSAPENNAPENTVEPEPSSVEVNPVAEKTPTAKKGNGIIAWLALLVALITLGLVGYLGWMFLQQQDMNQSLENQASTQRNQTQALKSAISGSESKLLSQFSPRDKEIAKLKESLVEAQLSLDAHSRRLLSLTATTTDDWRLAEVEYLLRLANQRILTSKDGQTALNLLMSSDEILLELADPRLFKVREAIANDRAALAVVGQQDLEGVFLELSALSKQINALPVLIIPTFETEPKAYSNAVDLQEKDMPLWLEKLQNIGLSTWNELKSLIVIQKRDIDIKPLLPPEQKFYLKNHLRLLLSQAQLALLDGRQQVYSETLTGAVAWLTDYFPQEASANREMAAALERLSDVVITTEYPDVSDSLIAVKAFIAEQHRVSQGHVRRVESGGDNKENKNSSSGSGVQKNQTIENTGSL